MVIQLQLDGGWVIRYFGGYDHPRKYRKYMQIEDPQFWPWNRWRPKQASSLFAFWEIDNTQKIIDSPIIDTAPNIYSKSLNICNETRSEAALPKKATFIFALSRCHVSLYIYIHVYVPCICIWLCAIVSHAYSSQSHILSTINLVTS